ncbi:hypothetical protein COT78_02335 [Candidatus Berkelbacteria bacterium CG10_big_fil_rev_8_21_14_0_10_43_13]|uniref:NAD(P)/FAD-dependent oxidoreductase n=1 Tax=Candidatus Berkelbacteria bacterium CG10_big_fil_rev_8_21_14_0_10_43_13 TaxID=1974514 RepID=A0A2H0W6G7_9BACT|nr:MAG: hypothetical protein COT78_02335 [Candidatus Berkelbacteria bacterium CG10_big_fil_rev_8_21_14_0_10_43_13]
MSQKSNIKVLGAGISGLTAAINLAKSGYNVEVFEKRADCGQRFHGDMQGIENWTKKNDVIQELKEMNIETNFDCTPFSNVTVTNTKIDEKFDFDRPLFYLVKRGDSQNSLDQGLKKQALSAGVKIYFNSIFKPDEADIVATGPNPARLTVADKGIIFKTKMANTAIAIVNDEFAHKGYSYLLVVDGYACLCSCVFNETETLTDCFNKTKTYFVKKYNLEITNAKSVGGVGYFTINNVWQKEKSRYVGEAAGLQDFLAGFGMRTAFRSGYLAAKSIIDNCNYSDLVEKEYRKYLKAGIVNRYLWEHIKIGDHLRTIKGISILFHSVNNLRSAYNFNLGQRFKYRKAFDYIDKKYSTRIT